jgi:hypothetical protein
MFDAVAIVASRRIGRKRRILRECLIGCIKYKFRIIGG